MLVITRTEGEEVVIGNPKAPLGIIRVSAVKGDRVRLAFDFPKEIEVNRKEVAEQKAKHGVGDPAQDVLRKIGPGPGGD
ncbi:MAG: carbon storage regulator [Planctomycetota bacterium]|nr:carbon storage regulator [Planctomycetota bacterium]MDA1105997.1 carbon storage regulator [Planctomycetota bacterium]